MTDRSLDDGDVASTVKDEGDKGGASDGLESDTEGYVYATNYEHNSIMRSRRTGRDDGVWEIVVHDPRLLWPDTLSLIRPVDTTPPVVEPILIQWINLINKLERKIW